MDGEGNKFTCIQKRTGKGIWQNLWEFPLLESKAILDGEAILSSHKEVLGGVDAIELSAYNEKPIIHKLSHQTLYTNFWILKTKEEIPFQIPFENLIQYPVPVLIADFIKAFKF